MLYLVATPIGNLADLSERAIKVLSEVDFIAAEDTRNSMKLLSYLEISKPMVSYFEHNKRERGQVIADRLKNGESCALITDAGTPAISDPGEDIVALCAEQNIAHRFRYHKQYNPQELFYLLMEKENRCTLLPPHKNLLYLKPKDLKYIQKKLNRFTLSPETKFGCFNAIDLACDEGQKTIIQWIEKRIGLQ